MRDTWNGNKSSRRRDRTDEKIKKAFKDPVSYLNRTLPKRMKKSLSTDMLRTVGKLTTLQTSNAMDSTAPALGSPTSSKKFTEKKDDAIPIHLQSNFNVNGSSVIHKAPPRPLTAGEARTVRKQLKERTARVDELNMVKGYLKTGGKFWIPANKLVINDNLSSRPLTAPPIRAARKQKEQRPRVPSAGAFRKRAIEATVFRKYYERGDLPVKIDHCAGGNKVLWGSDVRTLDYHVYLPIFVDGLREVDDPYRFLAIQGVIDMIQAAPEKLLPVVPQLILPINNALGTREPDIICSVLKILQQMLLQNPAIGQAFVPYFRSILPVFNLFRSREKNMGDAFDYGQRRRLDLGELIRETLEMFEMYGGPDAFINIKYMCPTYESCEMK